VRRGVRLTPGAENASHDEAPNLLGQSVDTFVGEREVFVTNPNHFGRYREHELHVVGEVWVDCLSEEVVARNIIFAVVSKFESAHRECPSFTRLS